MRLDGFVAILTACSLFIVITGCRSSPTWSESLPVTGQSEHVKQTRHEGQRRVEKSKRLLKPYQERSRELSRKHGNRRVLQKRSDDEVNVLHEGASDAVGYNRFSRIYIHAPVWKKQIDERSVAGGEPIAARFVGAPMRAVIDSLALVGNSDIITTEEIANKKVTFRVRHAGWRDVLAMITRTHGWEVHDDSGFIYVRGRSEEGHNAGIGQVLGQAQRVEMLNLAYVSAKEMKQMVSELFVEEEDKPLMSADQRTGSLVVKGSVEQINMVASLAKSLDRPVSQILIETFIVEAGKGLETNLGVRLNVDRFNSQGTVKIGGILGRENQSGADEGREGGDGVERWAVNLPVAAPAGGITALLDSDRLRVELTALEQEGKTRIVSNPRVFTLDGEEAVIFQGDEVPYSSVSESGTQTEFKEAGVRLAVTPKLLGDGNMMLKVTVNKDTVDTRLQNPPITRRQIDTTLLVGDGELVVIGGIYFDTMVHAQTRVPFFSRIPLLGHLFKRSQNTRDLRELLVFIAPRVVRLPS